MSIATVNKETVKDLQQLVWIASRRYMQGEISIEELAAVEKSYNLANRKAIVLLAIEQQRQFMLKSMRKNVSKCLSWLYLVFMYRRK